MDRLGTVCYAEPVILSLFQRRAAALMLAVALTLLSGCSSNSSPSAGSGAPPVPWSGRQFAGESTSALLDRWHPKAEFAGESEESSRIGHVLSYRLTGGEMTTAESQRFLTRYIELDRFGSGRQLARTPAVWPLDARVYVRAVAVNPLITTEMRWRRMGEPNWRSVAHYGNYAYFDLGPPAEGLQTVGIELQLHRDEMTVWQGYRSVAFEGRGRLADSCTLIDDPAAANWLRESVVANLRRLTRLRRCNLEIHAPPISKNPDALHLAFRVELIRDDMVVGEAHAILGRGQAPSFCWSPPLPMSIEWLRPDAALALGNSKWTARLTSVPELAATSEFDDAPAANPPPRKVWVGSFEIPLRVSTWTK